DLHVPLHPLRRDPRRHGPFAAHQRRRHGAGRTQPGWPGEGGGHRHRLHGHAERVRGGERGVDRRVHHPGDEARRLPPRVRGCSRGRRQHRRPDHAAGDGRRCLPHRRVPRHSVREDHRRRRHSRGPLLPVRLDDGALRGEAHRLARLAQGGATVLSRRAPEPRASSAAGGADDLPAGSELHAAVRRVLGDRLHLRRRLGLAVFWFVVGLASLTSLGLNLGSAIVKFAGGNLLLALFLPMLTSILVGTGIPTTPTYIIVALVSAPALIKMNVPPLAAHLFVFYYGALADVTPPTALSSYTAAGIAGADPRRTTWIAWKLATPGFSIPAYSTTNPVLLLNVVPVTPLGLAQAVLSAVVGTIALAMSLQGYVLRVAGWMERAVLLVAALLLIAPGAVNDLVGFGLLAGVIVYQKMSGAVREKPSAPVT